MKSNILTSLVGKTQQKLSTSRMGVKTAIKLKRQCDAIIGQALSSTHHVEFNGEAALTSRIAPHCRYVVDVGANVGGWILPFAAQMPGLPRGLLFEPSPETLVRLRKAIVDSGYAELEIVERAVADRQGTATFFAESDCGETASFVAGHSAATSVPIEVEITTLDLELARRDQQVVDYLKIDAEGFDLHVLKGAQEYLHSHRIKMLQFEYNAPWSSAGSTLKAAFSLLDGHGYKVRLLKGDGIFSLDPDIPGEYFRYSNFIAYCPGDIGSIIDAMGHKAMF